MWARRESKLGRCGVVFTWCSGDYLTSDCQPSGILGGPSVLQRGQGIPLPHHRLAEPGKVDYLKR
jgi:hypothetical protein